MINFFVITYLESKFTIVEHLKDWVTLVFDTEHSKISFAIV